MGKPDKIAEIAPMSNQGIRRFAAAWVCFLVAGWSAWLPVRFKVIGTLAVAVLLVALNAFALVRVLTPGFAPSG